MTIPYVRQRQFDMLAKAEDRLISWSRSEGVPLHQVEFVVPFVETDFDAHIIFFVETDEQISLPQMREAEAIFSSALRDVGYPEEHAALLTFEVDSHERVVREFEGSYFYRLR